MKYHDAANIFPMMSESELTALATDIEENGQQEPIEKYKGKILDGRNRYQACLSVEVVPEFVEWSGDDPVTYVLSKNLHRRHLTTSQRSMIAAKYKKTVEAKSYKREKSGKKSDPVKNSSPSEKGKSRDIAGEALKVSGFSVDQAEKVIDKGSKALNQAVESGEMPVSVAAKVAELPKREQNKIAKAEDPKKAAKEAIKPKRGSAKPDRVTLAASAIRIVGPVVKTLDELKPMITPTLYAQVTGEHNALLETLSEIKELNL